MSTPNIQMSSTADALSSGSKGPNQTGTGSEAPVTLGDGAGVGDFSGLLENYLANSLSQPLAQTNQATPLINSENLSFTAMEQYELPVDGKQLPPSASPVAWPALLLVDSAEPPLSGNPVPGASLPAVMDNKLLAGVSPQQAPLRQLNAETIISYQDKNTYDVLAGQVGEHAKSSLLQVEKALIEPLSPSLTDTQQLNQVSTAVNNPLQHKPLVSVQTVASTSAPAIPVPPQHPEWGAAVGERLQWMVNQNINQAEIRLDPPELGTLEVKVVVQKDSAHVNFSSQHASVRDAVEDAMPRLREMFSSVGLSLGDVNVSQESFQQQMNEEQETASGHAHAEDESLSSSGDELEMNGVPRKGTGLLDTYV